MLMDCGCIPIKKEFLRSQRSDSNDKRGEQDEEDTQPRQCSVRGFGVIRISESGHHCAYSYPNRITRGATDWFTRYRQCISKAHCLSLHEPERYLPRNRGPSVSANASSTAGVPVFWNSALTPFLLSRDNSRASHSYVLVPPDPNLTGTRAHVLPANQGGPPNVSNFP